MTMRNATANLTLLLMLYAGLATGQTVFVAGDEDGQGFLRQRGDACYLVTPQHVLGQAREAMLTTDRAERHSALLERSYDPDLAILRVASLSECPIRFPDGGALDRLLRATSEARLVSRSHSGAMRQTAIDIIASDERFIRVRARSGDKLFRGMSGSPLMIGGSTAGMLQSVDADSGTGTVLRQDYLSRVLQTWFPHRPESKSSVLIATPTLQPTTASNDVGALIRQSDQEGTGKSKVLPGRHAPIEPLEQNFENEKEDN